MSGKQIYIPSIDAKDLDLSSSYIKDNPIGYDLKLRDGSWNLRRFINSFDYSLDLIELRKIHRNIYNNNKFTFKIKKHEYSTQLINVTFKYSTKDWNQMSAGTFVKIGYDYRDLIFDNCIAKNEDGEVVGIVVDKKIDIDSVCDNLPDYFAIKENNRNDSYYHTYQQVKGFKTLKTSAKLRKQVYENGFICDGIHYVRCKRSAGSARQGRCLFINEALYKPLLEYSSAGIRFKDGEEVDLAAYESYISLTASSIIDTLPLAPENILVIDDYSSIFEDDAIVVRDVDGKLITSEERCTVENSIWDGQSIIDIGAMGEYQDKGMILLRNLFFKSCCFNGNIQEWFRDNGITEVSQLNGKTRAKSIEDIKLITTPNSIKYLKFGTLDAWLDHLYPEFGIVKYEKPPHAFGGRLVKVHYQLINSIQMSEEETRNFLQESLDFAQMLRDRPEVVRYYIKYPSVDEFDINLSPMETKNDIVYNLMAINDNFTNTRYYVNFLHDLMASYYKQLKNGKVYVEGCYGVLLGNPIEMLQQSIGKFNGETQMGINNVHTTRFEYGQTILGSRSPHISMSNVWLPKNTANEQIDKYINLTDQILCINSINENCLQRLAGADFDSDSILITNNKHLINAAERNYGTFKIATSFVEAKKLKRYYTAEQKCDLDIRTATNLIGEIVNLSQELNSLLWDRMYHGATYEDIKYIYYDICTLSVASGLAIDSAKKEFGVNLIGELDSIRKKYKAELTTPDGKKRLPFFFGHISRQKGYYDSEKKAYLKYHTSMDYLVSIVNSFKVKTSYKKSWLPFSAVLDSSQFRASRVNHKQVESIIDKVNTYITDRNRIYSINNITMAEKHQRTQMLYDYLIMDINSEVIGFSTMHYLLQNIENKDYTNIKNVLMDILFSCGNKSFMNAIIASSEKIREISDYGNDIFMFGIGYKIEEKKVNCEPK